MAWLRAANVGCGREKMESCGCLSGTYKSAAWVGVNDLVGVQTILLSPCLQEDKGVQTWELMNDLP
jgi:hypothetical protein